MLTQSLITDVRLFVARRPVIALISIFSLWILLWNELHFCVVDICAAAVVVVFVIVAVDAFPFSRIRFWSALFHQHCCSFISVYTWTCFRFYRLFVCVSAFFGNIFCCAVRKLIKIEWKIVKCFFFLSCKPDKMQFASGCFRHIINEWEEAFSLPQTNSIKCVQYSICAEYFFSLHIKTFLNFWRLRNIQAFLRKSDWCVR